MFNIIKESASITNKYLILATPLILFSLVSTIYLALSSGGTYLGMFISMTLFFLMFCAFISGWLYMVSICVKDKDEESGNGLIRHFVSGVGEYFLSSIGMVLISCIVGTVLFLLSTIIGYKFIGPLNIPMSELSAAIVSIDSMQKFLTSLDHDQLIKINLWNLLLFFTAAVSYYVILLYPPALFFKTKNPLKAFLYSQKDLFSRKFFSNIGLYIMLFIAYFFISIFVTLGRANLVLYFCFTLINFYFMVYASVLIFNYYYTNFAKKGSNIDAIV